MSHIIPHHPSSSHIYLVIPLVFISLLFKERIKEARKALGLSQAELARRMFVMFVTQPSVAFWELGRKAPHTKNLARLAMLLGVSFEWLTTGRGEMHTSSKLSAREPATDDWILPEERQLLSSYSRLKPKQRTALLGFLESLDEILREPGWARCAHAAIEQMVGTTCPSYDFKVFALPPPVRRLDQVQAGRGLGEH